MASRSHPHSRDALSYPEPLAHVSYLFVQFAESSAAPAVQNSEYQSVLEFLLSSTCRACEYAMISMWVICKQRKGICVLTVRFVYIMEYQYRDLMLIKYIHRVSEDISAHQPVVILYIGNGPMSECDIAMRPASKGGRGLTLDGFFLRILPKRILLLLVSRNCIAHL